jgi:hypothetical protein
MTCPSERLGEYALDRTMASLARDPRTSVPTAAPVVGAASTPRPSHATLIEENIRLRTENAVHLERQAADAKLLREAAAQLVVHKIDAGALKLRLDAREIELRECEARCALPEDGLEQLGLVIPGVSQ